MSGRSWIDLLVERGARGIARHTSRRSLLARLGAVLVGSAAFPLLPVARAAEGDSRLTYQLEQQGDMVKLMLTHEVPHIEAGKSKLIDAVSSGWPAILSSLKSLLETGDALEGTGKEGDVLVFRIRKS